MCCARQLLSKWFIFGLFVVFNQPLLAEQLQTVRVNSVAVADERSIDGLIEAVHQATISAQTSGRIIRIHVDVDDYVAKGDLLLEFSGKGQRAAYNAAKANLKQAEAEHKRIKNIYAQKLVAKAVLDRAESAYKSARARFEQAEEALEYTRVRAPYSGIVVKRYVELGENANVGQRLMSGLSLESLRAKVQIPQDMIHGVRKFKKAFLVTRDGQRVESESIRISPYADPESHSFAAQVNLPKGDYGVYPGMYAKVIFVMGEQQSLKIPVVSVVHRSEVTAVYVVNDKQQISFRQIRPGKRDGQGQIEVLAGLEPGEMVTTEPLHAGMLLKEQQGNQ
ncbi:MAG: efflux RND transporter periplasmic adaptor subunit [Gammaproteobacteria bacterium]|nr:efflux RND transporter periplasmic adaptor subunit [Gammaproteobacteria bacterium]